MPSARWRGRAPPSPGRRAVRAPPAREALVVRHQGADLLWHFNIGATFGITYTLLFGMGSWPLAFGGAFVWLAMTVLMPVMMPMIQFPWWFVIVPFLAHLAMALPIGWAALRFVDEEGAVRPMPHGVQPHQ